MPIEVIQSEDAIQAQIGPEFSFFCEAAAFNAVESQEVRSGIDSGRFRYDSGYAITPFLPGVYVFTIPNHAVVVNPIRVDYYPFDLGLKSSGVISKVLDDDLRLETPNYSRNEIIAYDRERTGHQVLMLKQGYVAGEGIGYYEYTTTDPDKVVLFVLGSMSVICLNTEGLGIYADAMVIPGPT